MIASPPISPFNPDDTLAAAILRDLASSRGSLAAVAQTHGVSIADLALWLDSPDARQRIAAIERGSYVAVRLAATINLPSAVDALSQILTDFRTLAKSGIDHNDPAYLRAAIQARKAALQLCRLSRAVPIDESHIKDMLAAARARAQARAQSPAPSTQRTASVNERATSSSPTLASHAPSALHALHPPAGRAGADSPRVACLLEEQACGTTLTPDLSSSPSTPAPLHPSSPFPVSPLRHSALSATSAVSSPSRSSSSPASSSPSKLGDSLAERTPPPSTRGGPQNRRGPLPADLIRAATGPPLPRGSSP